MSVLSDEIEDPSILGFDAAVEFQPNASCYGERIRLPLIQRLRNALQRDKGPAATSDIFSYKELASRAVTRASRPASPSSGALPRDGTIARGVLCGPGSLWAALQTCIGVGCGN